MKEPSTSKPDAPSWASLTLSGAIAAAGVVYIENSFLQLTAMQTAFLTMAVAAIIMYLLWVLEKYIIE